MNSAKLRAVLALSFLAVLMLGSACKRNHPPSIPEVTGRHMYRPGDTVRLSATATDQDDDSLSYLFAWVDSRSAVWTANHASGVTVTDTHAYAKADTYFVKVRARDTRGAESDWSEGESLRVGLFPPGVPACPAGPSAGQTGDTYRYSTCAVSPFGESLHIEYDWGGVEGGWGPLVASDSACVGSHVFYHAGTYVVKARAEDTTGLASPWSDSMKISIIMHDSIPPSVRIVSPADGDSLRRGAIVIKAVATDNQVVARVVFSIGGLYGDTDTIASAGDTFSYTWSDTTAQVPNQSFGVTATAYDAAGNQSSATIHIAIMGDLKWFWQNQAQYELSTSAVVANDGQDEVVMSCCQGDGVFYAIRTYNGATKCSTATRYPGYDFTGHPGLANEHVIVSSDDGQLYALTANGLSEAWVWPNLPPESTTYYQWGAPAFNGRDIYVANDADSLYKFTDAGSQVTRDATYGAKASLVDAPVIDAGGNVYFGTDSGYLVKIDANLTAPVWRTHLLSCGYVYGPIVGSDGTVYCGTDSFRIFAVGPDGTVRWNAVLDGIGARPALGRSALFVGTDAGTVYSINPSTGFINWQRPLAQGIGFYTTPVVAANGYLYVQDDNDVLFCLNQADGTVIWACDCNSYLPSRSKGKSRPPRKLQLTDYHANPSITGDGDIIVVGYNALFCVNGYKDGPLDPAAAWPRWQKNLSNTGR